MEREEERECLQKEGGVEGGNGRIGVRRAKMLLRVREMVCTRNLRDCEREGREP